MKKAVFTGMAIICAISLSACGKTEQIPSIQETENNVSENYQADNITEENLQTDNVTEEEIQTGASVEEDFQSDSSMEEEQDPIPEYAEEEIILSDNYFFPQGTDTYTYAAIFAEAFNRGEIEAVLHITEVQVYEEGILYELKIDCDMEVLDRGYRGEWRNLGFFYVQGDDIYFIRSYQAQDEYQTVEEILDTATLVCSEAGEEDALDEDERGWHEFIVVDGDTRVYHGYSNMVETGYYEHFYWERGKGLVAYESGYGAKAEGIDMYLVE